MIGTAGNELTSITLVDNSAQAKDSYVSWGKPFYHLFLLQLLRKGQLRLKQQAYRNRSQVECVCHRQSEINLKKAIAQNELRDCWENIT